MLVSHSGDYMANGLTNAVRHEFVMIANDRQTFVAVRKAAAHESPRLRYRSVAAGGARRQPQPTG